MIYLIMVFFKFELVIEFIRFFRFYLKLIFEEFFDLEIRKELYELRIESDMI